MSAGAATVFRPSVTARVVALGSTLGAAGSAVYALGSAFDWWEGNSCALAACNAEDLSAVWSGVFVVAVAATVLLSLLTAQVLRDRTIMSPEAVWVRGGREAAFDWAEVDRFELVGSSAEGARIDMIVLGDPIRLRGLTVGDGGGRGLSVAGFHSVVERYTDRPISVIGSTDP